ncbi:MAG: HD family hydrolase [Pseudomonadota bacterium]
MPKTARAWQRMLSGRRLDLLDPSPIDIEIDDIAHGLSRVARWNGQTSGVWPFSVAQHSLLVEEFCQKLKPALSVEERLIALLHDAPEYVVGDLISPFKAVVGGDYKSLEDRLLSATMIRFGLPATPKKAALNLVKRADRLSAYVEATQLAGFDEIEAAKFFGRPRDGVSLDVTLVALQPDAAKAAYLTRFDELLSSYAPSAAGKKR